MYMLEIDEKKLINFFHLSINADNFHVLSCAVYLSMFLFYKMTTSNFVDVTETLKDDICLGEAESKRRIAFH